jgi:hypothetical protein
MSQHMNVDVSRCALQSSGRRGQLYLPRQQLCLIRWTSHALMLSPVGLTCHCETYAGLRRSVC